MALRNGGADGHRSGMATIEFTAVQAPGRDAARALARAAVAAAGAPSLVAGRPWRWRINGDTADLYAETGARLLTLSCGAALHHARTALAGAGVAVEVTRCPDPARPDLLARLRVVGEQHPDPAAVRLHRAIALRSADGRPFPDAPVAGDVLDRLRAAAEAEGVHLRVADGGRFAVLYAGGDTIGDRLAVGGALSAVLLTATTERVAVVPVDGPPAAGPTALTLRLGAPATRPDPR